MPVGESRGEDMEGGVALAARDVGRRPSYASAGIHDQQHDDLPCKKPCPPSRDTTDALRGVLKGWLGQPSCPTNLAFCIPSMNMGGWALPQFGVITDTCGKATGSVGKTPKGNLVVCLDRRDLRKTGGVIGPSLLTWSVVGRTSPSASTKRGDSCRTSQPCFDALVFASAFTCRAWLVEDHVLIDGSRFAFCVVSVQKRT